MVPPSTSMSRYTGGVENVSLSACPQQAWRIFFLATVSLESLSLSFDARACAVAVWNAIMFALEAADIATLAADCASIIVWMMAITSGGLVVPPPMTETLTAAGCGPSLGDPTPFWLWSTVATLCVPLLWGLLTGAVTAVRLACPPNTLEKLLMVGGHSVMRGRSSSASSGNGGPVQMLCAHVFVGLDITIRFHCMDMVLTWCSSLLAERHA